MLDKKLSGKQLLLTFIEAFLISFAISRPLVTALNPSSYGEKVDYFTASIYQLLGTYNFLFILMLILAVGALLMLKKSPVKACFSDMALGGFLSLALLVSESCKNTLSLTMIFGSLICFCIFILKFAGYTLLLGHLIALLLFAVQRDKSALELTALKAAGSKAKASSAGFTFLKSFLILFILYGVFIVLDYPGNLCWDSVGQIQQVELTQYSSHHPLLHTLLMGGLVKFGDAVLGSKEIGLFLYMLVQDLMFSAAFAGTIAFIQSLNPKKKLPVRIMLALYLITPIYSNLVSTAIKDIPFIACVIGYVLCTLIMLQTSITGEKSVLDRPLFMIGYTLIGMLTIMFRNNGIIIVIPTGIAAFLFLLKKVTPAKLLKTMLISIILPLALGILGNTLLSHTLDATAGGKGEALSLPLQITSRYIAAHEAELTDHERAVLTNVLGEDLTAVANAYRPELSDYVKAYYRKDATISDTKDYILVWIADFFKDPVIYINAGFTHIYGWFDPFTTASVRYDTTYEDIYQGGIIKGVHKVLIFAYRFADRFSPLGLLQNVGIATWALILLSYIVSKLRKADKKSGKMKQRQLLGAVQICTIPLYTSLLVCMASPAFMHHPRYGLPIMTCLPLLYATALLINK